MAQDTNAQFIQNTLPMAPAYAGSTRAMTVRPTPDSPRCRPKLQRSAILYIDMIQVVLHFREPHTSLRYPHVVVHVAQPQAEGTQSLCSSARCAKFRE